MNDVAIRLAAVEDAAHLAALLRDIDQFQRLKAEPEATTVQNVRAALTLALADDSHTIWIAVDANGVILAYAAVHWLPYLFLAGPEGYLSELFVRAAGAWPRAGHSPAGCADRGGAAARLLAAATGQFPRSRVVSARLLCQGRLGRTPGRRRLRVHSIVPIHTAVPAPSLCRRFPSPSPKGATSMSDPIYARSADILQTLLRFDTTNPPGNEAACIAYINDLLVEAGFHTTLLAKDPRRPNLVARLAGRGEAPALVLQGHVDVVTTANQNWAHPPFAGELVDGYLWGRGALDMKGGVAMMLAAVLRAKAEGLTPAGDVILTVMADEEAGSDYGARFLTEQHAEQFEGAAYAIGEGGGASQMLFDRRYYLIAVAEKQVCWMRAGLSGPGGHGSTPLRGGAMAKLGRLLSTLDAQRLPVHITPVIEQMVEGLAASAPADAGRAAAPIARPGALRRRAGRVGRVGRAPGAHVGRAAAQHGQRHRGARRR